MTHILRDSSEPSWVSLLGNPESVRGAYAGDVPTLDGFLLEAVLIGFDKVVIAGQLNRPPHKPPAKWYLDDRARADLVLDLVEIRNLSLRGSPSRGSGDDSNHGWTEGSPIALIFEPLSEPFISDVNPPILWKRLTAASKEFSFACEAGVVQAWVGPEWRRRQFRV